MAHTVICETTESISLEEFHSFVARTIDPNDPESLLACAPMLRKLANRRELLVQPMNQQIRRALQGRAVTTTQVIYLGEGKDFYVRANIWPSRADIASGRVVGDQFSYDLFHDHNFNFLTTNHWGPGYVTEVYEYNRESIEGRIGEAVQFEFLERIVFSGGKVMMYRAGKDVHIQYPPDDLTITLNLMCSSEEIQRRDQYFFDLARGTLVGFPSGQDGSRRISIIEMAAQAGDDETRELLEAIGKTHQCQRTRLSALQSLVRLEPNDVLRIWELAARDPAPFVSGVAREKLAAISRQ